MSHCVPPGSEAFAHVYEEEAKHRTSKLAPRARPCKLIGYTEEYKNAYVIQFKGDDSYFVRRDVRWITADCNTIVDNTYSKANDSHPRIDEQHEETEEDYDHGETNIEPDSNQSIIMDLGIDFDDLNEVEKL